MYVNRVCTDLSWFLICESCYATAMFGTDCVGTIVDGVLGVRPLNVSGRGRCAFTPSPPRRSAIHGVFYKKARRFCSRNARLLLATRVLIITFFTSRPMSGNTTLELVLFNFKNKYKYVFILYVYREHHSFKECQDI